NTLQELLVKRAIRSRLLKIDELQFSHVPVLGPIKLKCLIPKLHLVEFGLLDLALQSQRLENCYRLVLAFYPHPVDLATNEAGDALLGNLADYDISPVLFCDAF